ncbi:MAG: hypothetical protein ABGX16_22210 [Pirellulales bacterium]
MTAIASADRAVYMATPKGLGIIEYEPYTLQQRFGATSYTGPPRP